MKRGPRGYFQAVVEGVGPGSLYIYRLDGAHERADPASRYQPQDVHGPSQVVAAGFPWQDRDWDGLALGGASAEAGRVLPGTGAAQVGDSRAGKFE